jgi:hypothetical protein
MGPPVPLAHKLKLGRAGSGVNASEIVRQMTSLEFKSAEFKSEEFARISTGKIHPLPNAAVHDVSARRPLPQEPSALLVRFNTLSHP